jgi:hypothetical protein
MTIHLVNPSHLSFGVGVITPRWLFVLAGATPLRTASRAPFISRVRPAVCYVESVVGLRERPTGRVRIRDAVLG